MRISRERYDTGRGDRIVSQDDCHSASTLFLPDRFALEKTTFTADLAEK